MKKQLLPVLVSLFALLNLQGAAKKKSTTTSGGCDASLWKFVYNPARLPAKNDCRAVPGIIENFVAEGDGDYHIRLIPDDKSLLNNKNKAKKGGQHGALVAEPICQNVPTQDDAIEPCKGYTGPKPNMSEFCPGAPDRPPAPAKGAQSITHTCKQPPRVRITGFYTIDNDHGWMELHTVSKIEIVH
jgi:hypothetical protein